MIVRGGWWSGGSGACGGATMCSRCCYVPRARGCGRARARADWESARFDARICCVREIFDAREDFDGSVPLGDCEDASAGFRFLVFTFYAMICVPNEEASDARDGAPGRYWR